VAPDGASGPICCVLHGGAAPDPVHASPPGGAAPDPVRAPPLTPRHRDAGRAVTDPGGAKHDKPRGAAPSCAHKTIWRLSSGLGCRYWPVPRDALAGICSRAGGTPRGAHNRIGGTSHGEG
jgi:hypothetical protein